MGYLLSIFTFILIGTIIGYFTLDNNKRKNWKSYFSYTIPWTFTGVLITALVTALASVDGGNLSRDADSSECQTDTVSLPIISIGRNSKIEGSFILGTGGINSVEIYYAYIEQALGHKLTTFNTYNTYIIETEGVPKYVRIDYLCEKTFYNWLMSANEIRRNSGRFGQLYVPKDTILRKFEL